MSENETKSIQDSDVQLGAALQNAFASDEPSEGLKQRVAWIAERHDNPVPKRPARFRFIRATGALALLVVVLGGTLAWKYLFGRPGETAIQLIPADAALVVTLDTTPSPAQAPLFLRLKRALESAHIDSKMNDMIKGAVEDASSPISAEIRPYLTTNFAFAMLDMPRPGGHDNGQPVVFLAVNNAGKVEELLARSGRHVRQSGFAYYRLKKDDQCAMVVANYLVLSTSPSILARVQMAYQGRLGTVAGLREYQEARAELPEDATLMVFVSPSALHELDGEGRKLGVTPFRDTRWMAVSSTLRNQGLVFDYRAPVTPGRQPRIQQMAQAPAIDMAAYKQLPSGAYGVFALSDPASYWDYLASMVADDAKSRGQFDRGLHEFETQTGLSVSGDILPALRGRTLFAVYPNSDDATAHPEGLIVIDDSNGANPAALVEKVKTWLQRTTAKKGNAGARFIPAQQSSITVWHLDPDSRAVLGDTIGSILGGIMRDEEGPNGAPHTHEDQAKRPAAAKMSTPTPVYAQVGNSILVATSQAMLQRAIQVHQGLVPTLAEDPAFTAMRQMARPGTQGILMVNLAAIMGRVEPYLKDWMKDESVIADDIVHVFGAPNTGLVASGNFDGQVERGSLFLPLDYDRLARLIKAGMDQGTDIAGHNGENIAEDRPVIRK